MNDERQGGDDDQQKGKDGGPPRPGPGNSPFSGGNFPRSAIIIAVVLGFLVIPWLLRFCVGGSANEITYTKFKDQVEQGNVATVVIRGNSVQGEFSQPVSIGSEDRATAVRNFSTQIPSFGDPELMGLLEEQNVSVRAVPQSDGNFFTTLISLLPFVIMIWIFYTFYKNMQSQNRGMLNFGKSRAKQYKSESADTKFSDVAGLESAKTELEEVVEFLKNPKRYEKLGAETPKGLLLVGPPGTGKTLLARAVAGEADVPFFHISGSDFMEMFVGVGAKRVRDLFKDAKKKSPSIIFIDELDSIGRQRGAGLGGGHDEREQTLNQLLSELDGFEPNENVIVMAATNRPDILDQALLRPGRFDRRVTADLPSKSDREQILGIHAKGKVLAEEVDLSRIAKSTPGFSGADLANLLNEAALIAARDRKEEIENDDVDQARDKILLGIERTGVVLTDSELRDISYHEAGHALVAAFLPNTDPVQKVTIVPRSQSLGVTQQMPERDKYLYGRNYLRSRLAVMMGGRAAEVLKNNEITSGAENDLKQATSLARRMVLDFGMSDELRHLAFGSERRHVFLGEELGQAKEYSEETARKIDEEVGAILSEAFQTAHDTLEEHEDKLDEVAEVLQEQEEMSGAELLEIVGVEHDDS